MRGAVLAIMSLTFLATAQDLNVTPTLLDTTDLADAPGDGRRLGVLLSGAPVRVLERDGAWVKVSVEGWIESNHLGAATAAVPVAPAAGGESGRITGSVFITEEDGSTTVGSGIAIRLLRDGDEFMTAAGAMRDACDSVGEELAVQIAALKEEGDLAMRKTDDTSEAFRRYDEAKSRRRRAEKALAAHTRDCTERIETLVESHTVARALSGPEGRYEIPVVEPGRYVLHAALDSGDNRSVWDVAITLGSGEELVGDLTSDNRTRRIAIHP